jgi:hypothetical protein
MSYRGSNSKITATISTKKIEEFMIDLLIRNANLPDGREGIDIAVEPMVNRG